MANSNPPVAPPRVRQLATDLADAKAMRRGSLSERTIKCSNTNEGFPACGGSSHLFGRDRKRRCCRCEPRPERLRRARPGSVCSLTPTLTPYEPCEDGFDSIPG